MSTTSTWILIVVVAVAFAIFVANAVYMGGIVKALGSPSNDLKLSKGGAEAFLWIDSILAAILGVVLIYLIYTLFANRKTDEIEMLAKGISSKKMY